MLAPSADTPRGSKVMIEIDPDVAIDHEVLLEQTPYTFEPLMAFGANAFTLTIGPAKN